jgi:hypothetical protein
MQLINIAGISSKIIRPRSFAVIDKDPEVFKFTARHTAFVINKVAVTPFDVRWVMNLRLPVNGNVRPGDVQDDCSGFLAVNLDRLAGVVTSTVEGVEHLLHPGLVVTLDQ